MVSVFHNNEVAVWILFLRIGYFGAVWKTKRRVEWMVFFVLGESRKRLIFVVASWCGKWQSTQRSNILLGMLANTSNLRCHFRALGNDRRSLLPQEFKKHAEAPGQLLVPDKEQGGRAVIPRPL